MAFDYAKGKFGQNDLNLNFGSGKPHGIFGGKHSRNQNGNGNENQQSGKPTYNIKRKRKNNGKKSNVNLTGHYDRKSH